MKEIRTNILIKILKSIYNKRPIASSVQKMPFFNGNILIIAPHADDEIVGCGGVIQECVRRNLNVYVLCITVEDERSVVKPTFEYGTNIRILESIEVKNYIGYISIEHLQIPERSDYNFEISHCIQEKLFEMLSLLKIETIFVPNYYDRNPDHRKICSIVLESTNKYINYLHNDKYLKLLFLYEVWGPTNATHYYILSENQHQKKLNAMKMYKTQMNSVDYCRIIETINNLRVISFNRNCHSSYSDNQASNKEFYELIKFDYLPFFLTIIKKI